MSLIDEVARIAGLIAERFPEAAVHQLEDPQPREANAFAIGLRSETRKHEGRNYALIERQYTITCYMASAKEALLAMESISRLMLNESTPVQEASEATLPLRVDEFSYEGPSSASEGVASVTGTMRLQSREAGASPAVQKMNHVHIRTTYQ
ncbi:hypothetical protein ACFFSY_21925 [Paenibacillus aurantiacus]|uniref:DUF3168 domain-containing protein n=1 Tax=Paenibacillus aurantiacus TaxID=1936118 RepID=A0ABV5KTP5_9BACL